MKSLFIILLLIAGCVSVEKPVAYQVQVLENDKITKTYCKGRSVDLDVDACLTNGLTYRIIPLSMDDVYYGNFTNPIIFK